MLEVHCVPHGGKGWLSTHCCHYFSSVGWLQLNAKFMHQRAGRKPQGVRAVILIKHMLPRGKTWPTFIKERSNPGLIPLCCQTLPGAGVLVSNHSGPPCPSGTSQVRSQRKVRTWTWQQIKWNATESQPRCETSFCRTKRSFHNLVLRNSITSRQIHYARS